MKLFILTKVSSADDFEFLKPLEIGVHGAHYLFVVSLALKTKKLKII